MIEKPRMLVMYKSIIAKMGYNIIYDGTNIDEDNIFFVMQKENKDNPKEPTFIFYDIFMGAPLSLSGFEEEVINKRNSEDFIRMIDARIKGVGIPKSEVLAYLLMERYKIDDVYINGDVKLTPGLLRDISVWVNFKGGLNAKPIEPRRPNITEQRAKNIVK